MTAATGEEESINGIKLYLPSVPFDIRLLALIETNRFLCRYFDESLSFINPMTQQIFNEKEAARSIRNDLFCEQSPARQFELKSR